MCEMISLSGFDLHFPDDWRCQAFFIYPLAICISSLEKCLFKTLANFLIELLGVGFFSLEYRSSLFVWQLIPYKICASFLFHSVDVSFGLKKFLVWYIPTCLFLLCCLYFWHHIHEIMKQCVFISWWSYHISKI